MSKTPLLRLTITTGVCMIRSVAASDRNKIDIILIPVKTIRFLDLLLFIFYFS